MEAYSYSKTHSLVNLSASILQFFGAEHAHTTIPEIDELLQNSHKKKVAVVLFDGLNKYIKSQNLHPRDALIRKVKAEITSVFPPTTVAATTAFLSERFPYENGWMGWSQHFNSLDVTVDMFSNRVSSTGEPYQRNLSYEYCSYTSILDRISSQTDAEACSIFPANINNGEADSLPRFFQLLNEKSKGQAARFIYAYWPDPDHTIHAEGTHSSNVRSIIRRINRGMAKVARQNKDTVYLVIADHGLIDAVYDRFDEHPDLYQLLHCPPYLDSRSLFVKVKEGKKEEFYTLFQSYYSDHYRILTAEDVLERQCFGFGEKHPRFDDFLGDFLITSLDRHTFDIPDAEGNYTDMVACHAGSMEEEFVISVAVFNEQQKR